MIMRSSFMIQFFNLNLVKASLCKSLNRPGQHDTRAFFHSFQDLLPHGRDLFECGTLSVDATCYFPDDFECARRGWVIVVLSLAPAGASA